ncbi:hypothetical protein [Mycoplasmopsis verecunda]|uniref:hypothetical protein n=1 Tax=Mycoplasmopsis verecunda TaxID=171291 RepID=UPI0013564005|nr:hypothetical protein [Mycoplasmopsis verecunda]WPB54743.1 hypothetical protein SAM46_01130 [Mycoplasmopsis verecunda]
MKVIIITRTFIANNIDEAIINLFLDMFESFNLFKYKNGKKILINYFCYYRRK